MQLCAQYSTETTGCKHTLEALITPSVGVMGAPASQASVLLQECANPPAEKKAPFVHDSLISQGWVPTCCPCTVSASAGYRLCGTWQKDDPSGGGHDTNGIASGIVDLVLTRTLFVLPCIFPATIFHASFALLKQTAALLGESLGNLV